MTQILSAKCGDRDCISSVTATATATASVFSTFELVIGRILSVPSHRIDDSSNWMQAGMTDDNANTNANVKFVVVGAGLVSIFATYVDIYG